VLKTDTGTYVSGGIIRGKSAANPDLGWAAGRTDGVGYAHTGIFRDATDATYKFFDGYEPEPDESLFIDTSDASFALAPILVGGVTSTTLRLTSTDDVNTTSTTHAFQVGADSGTNLRLDGNEIQVLNNGATGTLFINNEGGPVNIGTAGGSNVVVNGSISANNISFSSAALGTTGTQNLDFALDAYKTMANVTGTTTFTASNYTAGRTVSVLVRNLSSSTRTLNFPATWVFVGQKPANVAATTTGVLTITSFGTTEAECVAAWAVEI
jgi:hypothetical protein